MASATLQGNVTADGDALPGATVRTRVTDEYLLVANAACDAFWSRFTDTGFDVVLSLGVLEHVPTADLEAMLAGIHSSLNPGGLAVLRPNVFTGLTGGHLHEWSPDQLRTGSQRSTEPWEHLRSRRGVANTYLNELPRRGYMQLFEQDFDILGDAAVEPQLGRAFLTDGVRDQLAQWDEYELMSNEVTLVLRPRLRA